MSAIGRILARPRWFVLAVLMAVLVPGSVALGFWQLDRLEGRHLTNDLWTARLDAEAVPWAVVQDSLGSDDAGDLRYVRVSVVGEYLGAEQVLIRNRGEGGTNGNWVVTPLLIGDGRGVAVLRGWVPFALDDPADPRIIPPVGTLTVEGVLVPGEHPAGFGPIDPPTGRLSRMALLDLARLGEQAGVELGDLYVQQTAGLEPPAAIQLPDLTDTGPHLAYAIQWFSFAVIGAVGFGALLRRELHAVRKEQTHV